MIGSLDNCATIYISMLYETLIMLKKKKVEIPYSGVQL